MTGDAKGHAIDMACAFIITVALAFIIGRAVFNI